MPSLAIEKTLKIADVLNFSKGFLHKHSKKCLTQHPCQIPSPRTCAIVFQIILIKTTSVFNGSVYSKTVKIPKSLD